MAKLKNPLLSLKASGSVGRVITFLRRKRVDLVEKKPELIDAHTSTQLAWRHMFNKCVDLWHLLSPAEKQEWESQARSRHMTGYAWFISQCLRPNPGIYLPLQGGTMSGDIDMDDNRIFHLIAPTYLEEPVRKKELDDLEAKLDIGARVYHSVNQAIPHATFTTLTFDSERYDTGGMHSPGVNPSRLTCTVAGKYVIVVNLMWPTNVAGVRSVMFRLNDTVHIAFDTDRANTISEHRHFLCTVYELALSDFIEVRVRQTSGGALNVTHNNNYSPEFTAQRIG